MTKKYLYEGEVLPSSAIKLLSEQCPEGYVYLSCQVEQDCYNCDGDGRVTCNCGYEHPCNACDGNGRDIDGDTVWIKRSYYAELEQRSKQRKKIEKRYGRPVKNVADWWIA